MKKIFEKWFLFFLACIPVLWASGAFAQDMSFAIEQAANYTAAFLAPYIIKYPAISIFLLFVGTCRLLFKPIFGALQVLAPQTKTDLDDKAVSFIFKLMQNKYLSWFIDYIFSVKTKIEKK